MQNRNRGKENEYENLQNRDGNNPMNESQILKVSGYPKGLYNQWGINDSEESRSHECSRMQKPPKTYPKPQKIIKNSNEFASKHDFDRRMRKIQIKT